MNCLLFYFLVSSPTSKVIKAKKTLITPRIDGFIEDCWAYGDSVFDFVQYCPKFGNNPSEKTVVYILLDKDNIYVAFKCYFSTEKPFVDLGGKEDRITLYLDTFNSKREAYYFGVTISGLHDNMLVLNNGKDFVDTWDCVWFHNVRLYNNRYEVEMKIPFKAIRYKKGLNVWGINFRRYIGKTSESDYWSIGKNGFRVSDFGLIKDITPHGFGLHIEAYPVVILRYENRPSLGLGGDASWDFLPSAGVSFTFLPDFAQIEADPYKINLSKYELYFPEKRPFYTQQSEYFNTELTSFIRPFYSRRIGKKLPDGTEVPIIYGGKFTGSFGRWDIGILNAMTGESEYIDYYGDTLMEEKSNYYCVRAKRGIFYNSTIGMIYAGKRDENNKNEIYGVDGSFRTSDGQLSYLFSVSNKNDTIGFGGEVKYDYSGRKFIFISDIKKETKDFNIEEIGYAPYRDYEEYTIYGGLRTYNKGIIRYMHTGLGVNVNREGADPGYGYGINSTISINFTNNYGISFSPAVNYDYEMGKFYRNNNFSLMFWTDTRKTLLFNPSIWYNSYEYNYRRGHFGANGGGRFYIRIRPTSRWSISISPTVSIEWKEDKSIENISYIIRPSTDYFITKDLSLRFYAEPNTDTHIHYFSGLLSYNFAPKSWFYLGYNEERDNTEGNWGLRNRILVAKVRYLFFW